MVLGITNYLSEDIENVNIQLEKLIELVGEDNLHIFIFHDNNYEQSYHKYEKFKNLTLITENKNKGTLYGRIEIIKKIPPELNNEFLVWLDADDYIHDNIDCLLAAIEKYKDYDYVTPDMGIKCVWFKLVKVGAYKRAIEKFNIYPGLRMRLAECNILTAALLDLCYKNEIKWIAEEFDLDWVYYSGWHQSFDIRYNFDDDCRRESLKVDMEELAQWVIWKEIDKPDFDINVNGCDHVYRECHEKFDMLDKEKDRNVINKINRLITNIVKDMPDKYKEAIEKDLRIKI